MRNTLRWQESPRSSVGSSRRVREMTHRSMEGSIRSSRRVMSQERNGEQGSVTPRPSTTGVSPGTIAVTIAANIADTAILDRPMCFPDSVVGVTVCRPHSTRWIEMCIHAAQQILRAHAPQSAQKNINLQDLRPLVIPVPDPARQHAFAELWEEHQKSVDRELHIVAKLNQLRSGLTADLLSGRVRTVAS